jgi:NAD(P)-dependent dehydrogenase (short-subunit alcohol dehydrogenase family)
MASERGHVLVTGTSTGIGEATALHLAEQGFHVFAGVRRAKDGDALRAQASAPLTPVILDVTKEQTIAAARKLVEQEVGKRGLAGVVNNAGIAVPGPLELQPMSDFRLQLETNLLGPLAVIQAFMPLIRRAKGRIVNVGSVGGMVVLPITGAYSVSKFGLHAMSDALRLELRQWGIHVSLVQVAPVESAIYTKTYAALDGLESKLGAEGYRRYEPQITAVRKATEKAESDAESAVVIAKAVHDALTSSRPRAKYLAGHGGRQVQAAAALPDGARDKALARELGLPKPE